MTNADRINALLLTNNITQHERQDLQLMLASISAEPKLDAQPWMSRDISWYEGMAARGRTFPASMTYPSEEAIQKVMRETGMDYMQAYYHLKYRPVVT